MIGRIKNLSATSRSGFIQAENGQTVYFAGSEVWEHDFPFLAVGQAVSFELQAGHWPKASNVHLFEDRHLLTYRKSLKRLYSSVMWDSIRRIKFARFVFTRLSRESPRAITRSPPM